MEVLGERKVDTLADDEDAAGIGGLDNSTLEFSIENLDGLVVENLTQLWASLGLDPPKTAERLRELSTALRNVYAIELQRTKDEVRIAETQIQTILNQTRIVADELSPRDPECAKLPALDHGAPLLHRVQVLRHHLAKLEVRRSDTLKVLREKQGRVIHLYTLVLGERVELLGARFSDLSDDISPQREKELDTELHHLETFVQERNEFIPNCLNRIAALLEKLGGSEIDVGSQTDTAARAFVLGKLDTATLGCTRKTVDAISSRETALLDELASRETRTQALRDEANHLAASMRIPQDEWDAFISANNGCRLDDIRAYVAKIEELSAARQERLEFLLANARAKFLAIHENIHTPIDELDAALEKLPALDFASEELLAVYEQKIVDVEKKEKVVRPVFDLLKKRVEARAVRAQMAEEMKDPNRLYTPTGRLDNVKIQREEKLLKTCRSLPKIQAELIKKLKQFEKENNTPFLLDGAPLLETVNAEIQKDEQTKRDAKVRQKAQLEREVRYGTSPTPSRTNPASSHRIASRMPTPAAKVRSALRESSIKSPAPRSVTKSRAQVPPSNPSNPPTPTQPTKPNDNIVTRPDQPKSPSTPAVTSRLGVNRPIRLSLPDCDGNEGISPTRRSTGNSSLDTFDSRYSEMCDAEEVGDSSTVQELTWAESPIASRVESGKT